MVIACVAGKRVENCYWSVLNPVAAVNTCARLQTCETIPLMSPVLEGRRMVLDCLARLEKADTYCSATLSEAAAFPFCTAQTNQKKIINTSKFQKQSPITWSVIAVVLMKRIKERVPAQSEPQTAYGWPWLLPPLWLRLLGPHLEETQQSVTSKVSPRSFQHFNPHTRQARQREQSLNRETESLNAPTSCFIDLLLFLTLWGQDLGLFTTLSDIDGRLPCPFRLQNRGSLFTLSLHLHRKK